MSLAEPVRLAEGQVAASGAVLARAFADDPLFYDPTFTLELMLKDVTLATEMAASLLAELPILRETLAAYAEGKRRGSGAEDFSAVTHVLEDRIGHRLFGVSLGSTRKAPRQADAP
jgi:3-hydroxyisobutyrate dehydrogenase-like beta-hydroxyacid dehydrogenase